MKKRMAGYVRVSSAGQVKHKKGTNLKEGESLHIQAVTYLHKVVGG